MKQQPLLNLNEKVEIKPTDILGYGIRADGQPVAVGLHPLSGRGFQVILDTVSYESLKSAIAETEPGNFDEKDKFYCTANGYKEVFIRTKHND